MLSFKNCVLICSFLVYSQFLEMPFPEGLVQQKIQVSIILNDFPEDDFFPSFLEYLKCLTVLGLLFHWSPIARVG